MNFTPEDYPYKDMTSYVLSSQEKLPLKENVTVVNEPVTNLVARLKEQHSGDIWIIGGAAIVNPLIAANLIDDYHISITPHLLGEGIPLFTPKDTLTPLSLISQQAINEMIHTHYKVK